jgi:hypothetical protein
LTWFFEGCFWGSILDIPKLDSLVHESFWTNLLKNRVVFYCQAYFNVFNFIYMPAWVICKNQQKYPKNTLKIGIF